MHNLKLLVQDNVLDANLLVVTDISQYDDRLPLQNHTLFVQLPGFDNAVQVPFTIRGTVAYNSVMFTECGLPSSLSELPDGLYSITYSVAPNSKVFTVTYHFRAAKLEQEVYRRIGELRNCPDVHSIDDCGNTQLQKEETLLLRCLLLLEAIKANICTAADIVAAENNYNEISNMLTSLKTKCCNV